MQKQSNAVNSNKKHKMKVYEPKAYSKTWTNKDNIS